MRIDVLKFVTFHEFFQDLQNHILLMLYLNVIHTVCELQGC